MKKMQFLAITLLVLVGLTSPLFAEPDTEAPAQAQSADAEARPGKAPWIRKSAAGSHESDAILDLFKIGGTGILVIVSVLVLGFMMTAQRMSRAPKMTDAPRQRVTATRAGGKPVRASKPLSIPRH